MTCFVHVTVNRTAILSSQLLPATTTTTTTTTTTMASLRLCSSLRTVEASRLSRLPSNYVSTLNTRPIPRTTTRLQTRSFRQPPQPQQQQQQQPPPPSNTSPNKPVQSASSYSSPSTTSTPQQKPQQQQQTPADRASRVTSPTPTHPTTQNISQTGLSDKPLDASDSVLEPSTSTSTSTSPTTPSPSPSPAGSSEPTLSSSGDRIDWTRSFHGLSAEPFPKETADILLAPTDPEEVEIKPDGIIYLPEIKYRRILNRAFGPGGWGLVPRSESIVTPKMVTREYALVCNGRYVLSSSFFMLVFYVFLTL